MDCVYRLFADFSLTGEAFLPGLWFACLLDLALGDPRNLPHPVALIAWIASGMESFFRKHVSSEIRAGQATVVCTLLICGTVCVSMLLVLSAFSPLLIFSGSILLLYTTVALRSLADHALAVYHSLDRATETGTLEEARECVGRIVGRETTELDQAGIIRACVESVAENMSDGVIAPLFFAAGAATLCVPAGFAQYCLPAAATAALLYKVVNTMDSMFGYKNEQYVHFGRAAALLDDTVNYIPARLSAMIIVVESFITGKDGFFTWKILQRDKRKHTSPNAGYPEAAMAGALGLQLGGPSDYFGKTVKKQTIGNDKLAPVKEDIVTAVRIMISCSLLCIALFSLFYFAVLSSFKC
ncbi:MAG TPA: cobalamin biosynthesis protein CobD [Desulfobulbaceae bacterium]|nr:cobalamin biosynthesis protein CobD [Desulfobulbaceae bacterium]